VLLDGVELDFADDADELDFELEDFVGVGEAVLAIAANNTLGGLDVLLVLVALSLAFGHVGEAREVVGVACLIGDDVEWKVFRLDRGLLLVCLEDDVFSFKVDEGFMLGETLVLDTLVLEILVLETFCAGVDLLEALLVLLVGITLRRRVVEIVLNDVLTSGKLLTVVRAVLEVLVALADELDLPIELDLLLEAGCRVEGVFLVTLEVFIVELGLCFGVLVDLLVEDELLWYVLVGLVAKEVFQVVLGLTVELCRVEVTLVVDV
jgi:hypothetical protein